MVNYYVQVAELKNHVIGKKFGIINYETEIIVIEDSEKEKLIDEILTNKQLKEIFPDSEYAILELMPTHIYLDRQNEHNELYEQTKQNWENAMQSKEVKIKKLSKTYKDVIEATSLVIKESENLEVENSQEFLNFLDELNKLSVQH